VARGGWDNPSWEKAGVSSRKCSKARYMQTQGRQSYSFDLPWVWGKKYTKKKAFIMDCLLSYCFCVRSAGRFKKQIHKGSGGVGKKKLNARGSFAVNCVEKTKEQKAFVKTNLRIGGMPAFPPVAKNRWKRVDAGGGQGAHSQGCVLHRPKKKVSFGR